RSCATEAPHTRAKAVPAILRGVRRMALPSVGSARRRPLVGGKVAVRGLPVETGHSAPELLERASQTRGIGLELFVTTRAQRCTQRFDRRIGTLAPREDARRAVREVVDLACGPAIAVVRIEGDV